MGILDVDNIQYRQSNKMELTGACKKEFKEWLVCGDDNDSFEKYYSDKYGNDDPYLWFIEHSRSMQYGVLVDYFDSVGIYIDSINVNENKDAFITNVNNLQLGYFYTRPEARTQAISKANDLRNEQVKQEIKQLN